jgi:hypothetical protein
MTHAGQAHRLRSWSLWTFIPRSRNSPGCRCPQHLEGVSLKPVLDDPQRSVKTAAFSQYPRKSGKTNLMGYTMRTDRYRLTRWVHTADHAKVDAVELVRSSGRSAGEYERGQRGGQ